MNTIGAMPDLSAWEPWASGAVEAAYIVLGLVTIVIVSCIAAQIVTADGRASQKRTRRTH